MIGFMKQKVKTAWWVAVCGMACGAVFFITNVTCTEVILRCYDNQKNEQVKNVYLEYKGKRRDATACDFIKGIEREIETSKNVDTREISGYRLALYNIYVFGAYFGLKIVQFDQMEQIWQDAYPKANQLILESFTDDPRLLFETEEATRSKNTTQATVAKNYIAKAQTYFGEHTNSQQQASWSQWNELVYQTTAKETNETNAMIGSTGLNMLLGPKRAEDVSRTDYSIEQITKLEKEPEALTKLIANMYVKPNLRARFIEFTKDPAPLQEPITNMSSNYNLRTNFLKLFKEPGTLQTQTTNEYATPYLENDLQTPEIRPEDYVLELILRYGDRMWARQHNAGREEAALHEQVLEKARTAIRLRAIIGAIYSFHDNNLEYNVKQGKFGLKYGSTIDRVMAWNLKPQLISLIALGYKKEAELIAQEVASSSPQNAGLLSEYTETMQATEQLIKNMPGLTQMLGVGTK
jgi:hypothetical protein